MTLIGFKYDEIRAMKLNFNAIIMPFCDVEIVRLF